MSTDIESSDATDVAGPLLRTLESIARLLDTRPATIRKWVRIGTIQAVNIYGRKYVTTASLEDFLRRAHKGEFEKKPNGGRKLRDEHSSLATA